MAFLETFNWDWILVLLIALFLIIIIRNVYRLMKKRNEYMSFKEAREQVTRERAGHAQSKTHVVDAEFEEDKT